MAYSVKEIFYTLQGEGRQAGRAAVFCRFAGCNLWSGREQDRATAACSNYSKPFSNGIFSISAGAKICTTRSSLTIWCAVYCWLQSIPLLPEKY